MDGGGYSGDEFNSSFTTFVPFTTSDIRISVGNNDIEEYASCKGWSPIRVFLQIYLVTVLICNFFTCYVIITTTKRKGSPFATHCMLIINLSGMGLTLLLMFYPLTFTWNDVITTSPTTTSNYENVPIFEPFLSKGNIEEIKLQPLHICRQAGTIPCRTSGLIFGIFMYVPLVTTCVMLVDTVMAAFNWKMYRFRPHTASAIRLTLLISNLFAILLTCILPAVNLGTHYHYYKFLKICWLSDAFEVNTVQGFTFFIYGYIGTLVLVTAFCASLILKAYTTKTLPYQGRTGSCSMICGTCVVMKSKSWTSYSRLVICVGFVTVITYLPLTFGNIIRFSMFRNHYFYWFDVTSQLLSLVLPSVNPFLYIILFEPHRQRADEILNDCKGGPKLRTSGSSSSVSSLVDDQGYPRQAWDEHQSYNSNFPRYNYRMRQRQNYEDLQNNWHPHASDRESHWMRSIHRVNPLYNDERYSYHSRGNDNAFNSRYDRSNNRTSPIKGWMRQSSIKDLLLKQARKWTPSSTHRTDNKDSLDSAYSTFKGKKQNSKSTRSTRNVSFAADSLQRNNRIETQDHNSVDSYNDNTDRYHHQRNINTDQNQPNFQNRFRNQNQGSERFYSHPSDSREASEIPRDYGRDYRHQFGVNHHSIPNVAYRNNLYNNMAHFMNQHNQRERHDDDYNHQN